MYIKKTVTKVFLMNCQENNFLNEVPAMPEKIWLTRINNFKIGLLFQKLLAP